MEDLPQTMSMEDWCVFTYRAWHLGDATARLNLARLYKRCVNVEHNTRYALFWLCMAYESFRRESYRSEREAVMSVFRKDEEKFEGQEELSEEISTVALQVGQEIAEGIRSTAKYMSLYPFGLSHRSAPPGDWLERFFLDMSYADTACHM